MTRAATGYRLPGFVTDCLAALTLLYHWPPPREGDAAADDQVAQALHRQPVRVPVAGHGQRLPSHARPGEQVTARVTAHVTASVPHSATWSRNASNSGSNHGSSTDCHPALAQVAIRYLNVRAHTQVWWDVFQGKLILCAPPVVRSLRTRAVPRLPTIDPERMTLHSGTYIVRVLLFDISLRLDSRGPSSARAVANRWPHFGESRPAARFSLKRAVPHGAQSISRPQPAQGALGE